MSWICVALLPFWAQHVPNRYGIGIVVLGATLRMIASGFIDKEKKLSISGPFAYTRNPLYLGTLLIVLGVAVSQASLPLVLSALILGIIVFYPLVQEEEKKLEKLFPEAFSIYKKEVSAFFPYRTGFPSYSILLKRSDIRAGPFSKKLFLKNRGYEAALVVGGLILLITFSRVAVF